MWCEMVALDTGNSSRSLVQAHALSPAITSSTCIRLGSASALAISANCFSVRIDRPAPAFFTVQWLSNYLPPVKNQGKAAKQRDTSSRGSNATEGSTRRALALPTFDY